MRIYLVVLLAASSFAWAQEATNAGPGVFRITTSLVQIDAVVTDGRDRPVANLTKDDFQLLQDGKPMPITAFSVVFAGPRPSGAPGTTRQLSRAQVKRTIALVVDDYSLGFRTTNRVRDALVQFIDRDTREGDMIGLLSLGRHVGAYEQFTTDRALLKSVASRIEFNTTQLLLQAVTPGAGMDLESTQPPGGGDDKESPLSPLERVDEVSITSLHAVVDGMKAMPGRKSIVVFTTTMRNGMPFRNWWTRRIARGSPST